MKYKFGIALGAAMVLFMSTGQTDRYWEIAKNIEIFANLFKAVNEEHVDGGDPNKLMGVAIDSMLHNLDPYTNYFSEATIERFRFTENASKVGSIGAKLEKHFNGDFVIGEMYDDLAADKAGLRSGDIILEVDGVTLAGKKLDDVKALLQTAVGEKMKMKLKRPTSGKTMDVVLEASTNDPKNVPYFGMLEDGKTGYVVLTTFTQEASKNIKDAIKSLTEKDKATNILLDLRDNGGGLLMEAVDIVNLFVGKGLEVVTTKAKTPEQDRSFKTLNEPFDLEIPLGILINGRSASASEIVSGGIQDFDRGVLIGQRSFGKGLVQNYYDLPFNAKMKITTAKYYIPSGRCIQALDYSGDDAVEIPESQRQDYKTKAGRNVKGGGGVAPDLLLPKVEKPAVVQALEEQFLIFDFATEYQAAHDSISAPEKFALTDVDFERFVQMLEKRNFQYESSSEKAAKELEKLTAKEKLDGVKANLDNMKVSIKALKAAELRKNKALIIDLMESEIVGRYYFEKGKAIHKLRRDKTVREAIGLLNDKNRYKALLLK